MNDVKEAQIFIKNLSGNTKVSISKISRALDMSRQTYQNRIDALREKKIITNFSININPDLQPTNLKYVMIEIKTNPKEPDLAKNLLNIPQLKMLDGIIGEFSLFGLLIFRTPEEYYQTLNRIDNIMADSHFKKYQIIETIKVFKTNGISLRKANISVYIQHKLNLEEIAKKFTESEYNPRKFPWLLIRNPKTSIIIESNGRITFTDFKNLNDLQYELDKLVEKLNNIGINIDKKKIDFDNEIDDIDFNILKILRDNQGAKPISTYEIKDLFQEQLKIEISQSTIHNRIKRLEEKGIILNYTVNFHPKKIGFTGKYLLRVKPQNPSHYDELALKLEKMPQITNLFRIGEQFGLFAIVRVKKIEDYAQFIKDLYEEEIDDTFTNFVLDELIPYTNFVIF